MFFKTCPEIGKGVSLGTIPKFDRFFRLPSVFVVYVLKCNLCAGARATTTVCGLVSLDTSV